MTYLLVRHKVADFSKWKAEYDAHLPTRQKAGLEEEHLLRNIDNPDEVVLLFEAENLHEAQAFARSSDLREAMQKAEWLIGRISTFLLSVVASGLEPQKVKRAPVDETNREQK